MQLRRTASVLATLLVAAAGCDCGEAGTSLLGNIEIVINTPFQDERVPNNTPVVLRATASSRVGVTSLTLFVGTEELAFCEADGSGTEMTCEASFTASEHIPKIVNGKLLLKARGTDVRDGVGEAAITVNASLLNIVFLDPGLSQESPPLAAVRATTKLEVAVESFMPVAEVLIASEFGVILKKFEEPPFAADVRWVDRLGTGEHVVVAKVTDVEGNTAEARRTILISCGNDGDCSRGMRCCGETGTCNPVVGEGEDCDCERPCPGTQGCFPGTCGQTPRKCRPGCFPGTYGVGGKKADRCGSEDGRPAFCVHLPANESTTENLGGACSPADSCDVGLQNCPDMPLDRTRPPGPDNPAIAQNCVVAGPTTNRCIPAGNIPAGGKNCQGQVCTAEYATVSCAKGGLCVQLINPDGTSTGAPPYCSQLCNNPAITGPRRNCPAGQGCYPGIEGPGREAYTVGTCR